jgi:uncharacterized protein YbbC (DUF1343 family)
MRDLTQRLLMVALLASVATGGLAAPVAAQSVRPGVEVLADTPPAVLAGKRVGLITNHSGIDRQRRSTIDVLNGLPGVRLVALFSPEHGIRGVLTGPVDSGVDEATGLPIHSLYGPVRKPTPEMLEGIDALVFDIMDIGTRQYTYISTMSLAMEAAAEKGIPFVVLDRPNPLGGRAVEGNILEPPFITFVGIHPIPVRHGMTVGELARMFNAESRVGADLTVVPVEGWTREMWYDQVAFPWVNPSPNIRRLEAAIHYPGTVFFEAVNLSEGRGTDLPFEQTGASWLDAPGLAAEMNAMNLPGVRFEAITIPVDGTARKFPGETIPGVRFILTDREVYQPVRASLLVIDAVRRRHPEHFEWRGANEREPQFLTIERHGGTAGLRQAIDNGTLRQLLREWEADEARFRARREPFLLYR